jgi:putative copper resistance protein D
LIEAGLVAARFLHFAAATTLFGLALFPLYTRPSRISVQPVRVSRWLRTSIGCATVLELLSALAWACSPSLA